MAILNSALNEKLATIEHHLTVALRAVESARKGNGTTQFLAVRTLQDVFSPLFNAMGKIMHGTPRSEQVMMASLAELQTRESEVLDFLFPNPDHPRPQDGNKTLDSPVWHVLLDYAKGSQQSLEYFAKDRDALRGQVQDMQHANTTLTEQVESLKNQLASRPKWKTFT